jgi:hypothetical protein
VPSLLHMKTRAHTLVVNYLMLAQALFKCPSSKSNLCCFYADQEITQVISLGREDPFGNEGTLWLLKSRFVMNFERDPSEWFWGGLRTIILVPFYQYISCIGYGSITRREGMESIIILSSARKEWKWNTLLEPSINFSTIRGQGK